MWTFIIWIINKTLITAIHVWNILKFSKDFLIFAYIPFTSFSYTPLRKEKVIGYVSLQKKRINIYIFLFLLTYKSIQVFIQHEKANKNTLVYNTGIFKKHL